MTTYAYLRVSTLEQNTEKNKLEILAFSNNKKLGNVEFIEEQISGRANYKNRQLGSLLDKMQSGDILIVPELSRIARSITQIFEVIEITKTKGIILYSLKENFCSNGIHYMINNVYYGFFVCIGVFILSIAINKFITIMRKIAETALRGKGEFNDDILDDDENNENFSGIIN